MIEPPREPALSRAARKAEWQRATISDILVRTPTVKSFFVALAEPMRFIAGQHVDVRLTAEDGYQAQRSYSISSAPELASAKPPYTFELTIDRLDDGEVSPYFHDVAVAGDEIEFRGPFGGYFIWSAENPEPILLMGGGSGVAPLMSMIRHRAARPAYPAPMALLLSARTWNDVIFRDELLALHGQLNGFELKIALTREALRREGVFARRVDTAMLREMLERLPQPPKQVFICGSNPFVEAAAQSAMEAGIAASSIRTERYGG